MLAVGPIAVLPSPVFAALPTYTSTTNTGSFVVTNGSVVSTTGTGVIQASDRAVLVWGTGNFNIATGETYNFATSGSVLNKVGYNTNGTLGTADNAVINGTLLSSGRVFVLANGNILVGAGANITTTQGAILSTLQETTDFPFTTGGNLGFAGTSLGSVSLGNASSGGALVNVAGNLAVWSGAITTNNVTVSGDLVLNQAASAAGTGIVVTGTGGATTVNGNLTVTTNNGAITQSATALLTSTATTTLNTGGNAAITLNTPTNNFNSLRINAGTGTGGAVSLTDVNAVDLGVSRIGDGLTINAGGDITTSGAVTVTGLTSLTTTAGSATFNNGSSTTSFSASAPAGVTFNGVGNVVTTALTSTAGNVAVSTNGTATLGGTITAAGNNVTVTANNVSSNAAGAVAATANVVTINATAGTVVLPSITANSLVVSTANGSVSQATGSVLTIGNGTVVGNVTANVGTGNITLANANALRAVTTLTGNSASLTSSQNLVIGQTNLTGSLTINTAITTALTANAATVVIGTGSGTAATGLTVGGNMSITTNNSAVTDDSFVAQTVLGAVTINTVAGVGATGAPVILNAAAASPDGDRTQFGQFNVNAGNATVTLSETTTLNLGNITGGALSFRTMASGSDILINGQISNPGAFAATFNSNSAGGNITESASGNLNLGTGTATFNVSGNGSTNLQTASNSFGGLVDIKNGINNIIVSGTSISFITNNVTGGNVLVQTVGATTNTVTFGASGTSNAANVTINSAGPIVVGGGTLSVARLTLITSDTSATSITQGGAFNQMNNTLTLTSAGNIALTTVTNNITGNVVLNNVAGDTTIYSARNLTVSGTSAGNLTAQAGTAVAGQATNTFSGPWNLILGNLNVRGLNGAANNGNTTITLANILGNPAGGNATAGNSGEIRQLANTSVHVENDVQLVTFNGNVNLANNGNSFGRISVSTGGGIGLSGASTVSITEDSTLKVGNILSGNGGSANLTSRFGSIIEDPVLANTLSLTNLALNAPAGSVLLGNQDHTNATVTTASLGSVTANAAGTVKLISTGNLALGAINANSLVATSGNYITQTGRLNIFGTASFTSTSTVAGTGSITLTDATNNFGPVSVSTAASGAAVAITEGGTLNLRSAVMPGAPNNGTFTATSVNGDIIDTGLGGFKPGGTTAAPGTGLVTLSAINGNITIDDPTSDFQTTGGILFNAKNVTLAVLGGNTTNPVTLTLGSAGATSVAGNLTVTSIIGDIVQVGPINVTGNATFQTGTKNINLANSTNSFGALKFIGNQVSIAQTGNMTILTGSSATGQASLAANNGGITIVADPSASLVTFGNIVNLSATGNIVLPKLLQAVGTIFLSTPATANLSALSITQDLGGKSPNATQVLGTYLPPQP